MELIIDPGHGGHDPGAEGNGLREKDVVLTWGHLLARFFEANFGEFGFTTMTRPTDKFISLEERCEIANSGSDMADAIFPHAFLSLHCNSNDGIPGLGMEVYHYPGSELGLDLATRIHDKWPHPNKRGVKTAGFYVLKHTKIPAVLVEIGFINNAIEAHQMVSLAWAMDAAESMVDALEEWKNGRR